ncbi:MAG: hypothetical protein R3Y07_01405, partial [Eubacteriales bacterium]
FLSSTHHIKMYLEIHSIIRILLHPIHLFVLRLAYDLRGADTILSPLSRGGFAENSFTISTERFGYHISKH